MGKSSVTRKTSDILTGRRRSVEELATHEVQAGWSINMDADPETVAHAVYNTLGTDTIPARDALTPAVVYKLDRIREASIAALRSRSPLAVLDALADELQVELQRSVSAFSDPPNAPSTIERKLRNDPLVDTGEMLAQAAARVKRK
jgi:hypothetical protein